jgi:hypothetical protein
MDEATLRQNILNHAQEQLDDHITEDAGANRDTGGRIQKFFEVGAGWREDHRDLAWCAAFASYCVVSGFKDAGLPLPVTKNGAPRTTLHARCEDLKKMFSDAGRYVPLSAIYENGAVKPGARLPKPGDMILFTESFGPGRTGLHAGLVYSFDVPGKKLVAVEGNNRPAKKKPSDPDLPDGVYTHQVSEARLMKIDGFCVVAP